MAVLNRIVAFANEMADWRRYLHQIPELGLECHKTAEFVTTKLKEFGITQIENCIAGTGLVAIIEGNLKSKKTIGLRADMDALPINETTGRPWASKISGIMHACGHDGHTAMLLGAAKYLSATKNFSGRVALIFQPAEENFGGAKIMIEEGILDRYDISEIYALHNVPGKGLGKFYTKYGPVMAGADIFHIDILGVGGHAAYPHQTRDPITPAISVAQALQTIVTQNTEPTKNLVLSVTQIHSGRVDNIISDTAYLNGTVRLFDKEIRTTVKRRMKEILEGHSLSFGVEASLTYEEGYPPTVNDFEKTDFALSVARDLVGENNVSDLADLEMGAEDFSYMLEKKPGSYMFLGIGDAATLHNPNYDFNDEAAPFGASFFAGLVEKGLPIDV